MSSGDLDALSPERLRGVSIAYSLLNRMTVRNHEEVSLASGLGVLQFPAALSSGERSEILGTLTQLDQINLLQRLYAEQYSAQPRRLGIEATPAELSEIDRGGYTAQWILEGRAKYGPCFDGAIALFDPQPEVAAGIDATNRRPRP